MSSYTSFSDTILVELISMNDRRAFEEIYKRHAKDLYRYCRKNVSIKEDCEEIIQDLFESLWARHDNLIIQNLRAYLFQMVRYKVIRYFQHNKVKRKYEEHYKIFEVIYEGSAAEDMDSSNMNELVREGLSQLPKRCQEAMKLRLEEDLSNKDIAIRMNITKETVELYMSKALTHLRAYRTTYKPG